MAIGVYQFFTSASSSIAPVAQPSPAVHVPFSLFVAAASALNRGAATGAATLRASPHLGGHAVWKACINLRVGSPLEAGLQLARTGVDAAAKLGLPSVMVRTNLPLLSRWLLRHEVMRNSRLKRIYNSIVTLCGRHSLAALTVDASCMEESLTAEKQSMQGMAAPADGAPALCASYNLVRASQLGLDVDAAISEPGSVLGKRKR